MEIRRLVPRRPNALSWSMIGCRIARPRYSIDVALKKPEAVYERVDHIVGRTLRKGSRLAQGRIEYRVRAALQVACELAIGRPTYYK